MESNRGHRAPDDGRNWESQLLHELLDAKHPARPLWPELELSDVLRHQLAAPLLFDLSRLGQPEAREVRDLLESAEPSPVSFSELLLHPSPPMELLRMVKDFVELSGLDLESPLPTDVVLVLYYAVIGAALSRHRQRISSMSDSEMREGMRWAASREWVDASIRKLLHEALQALDVMLDQ